MTPRSDLLVWLDMEMTGLNPLSDKIIELAIIITDQKLNEIAVSPVWVVHQSDSILNNMSEWCINTHTKSGLMERCRQSTNCESLVQDEVIKWLLQYVVSTSSPLCGNSVHLDRFFLYVHMRLLHDFFHYKNLDVTSFALIARSYKPEIADGYKKLYNHTALEDIKESIGQMKFYVDNWLNTSD